MSTLNACAFLKKGFQVRESENHISITTPQTFASGDPARLWVMKDFEALFFNDYGFSHNALGLSIPQPDNVEDIIKRTLVKLGSDIEFNGHELTLRIPENLASKGMSDYLNLYAMLTSYQPKTKTHQDQLDRLEDIFIYLQNKYKDVVMNAKYKGLSGIEHHFDFEAENTLIDFSIPNGQSTGSLLRKIQDVGTIYDGYEFNIILDDGNKKQFEKESRILNTVASVTPLSIIEPV